MTTVYRRLHDVTFAALGSGAGGAVTPSDFMCAVHSAAIDAHGRVLAALAAQGCAEARGLTRRAAAWKQALRQSPSAAFDSLPLATVVSLVNAACVPAYPSFPDSSCLECQYLVDGVDAALDETPSVCASFARCLGVDAASDDGQHDAILDAWFPCVERAVHLAARQTSPDAARLARRADAALDGRATARADDEGACDLTRHEEVASRGIPEHPPLFTQRPAPGIKQQCDAPRAALSSLDHAPVVVLSSSSSSSSSQPSEAVDGDDLVMTPAAVARHMSTDPDTLPWEVVVACRRPIESGITEFELLRHYKMDELRAACRRLSVSRVPTSKHSAAQRILEALDDT